MMPALPETQGLRIPARLAQEIIAHARKDTPNECCGIMVGKDGAVQEVYRTTNIDHSPVKYTIDPQEMAQAFLAADKAGQDVLGFYHSHTRTEAYPSVTDTRLAPPSDLFDYQYVIVSLQNAEQPAIRCFRIVDRKVLEMPVEIVPG